MSFISELWGRIETAITGEAQTIEDVLTPFEQAIMPKLTALAKQIEATIGQQGLTIIEDALSDVGTVIQSGGNIGTTISTLIPQVISQVEDGLKQDAKNAAYGAVAITLASLPSTTSTASTPAPASS